jgi:hypothetical protein
MSAAEAAIRHLQAAREEFVRERSELDRNIESLDAMIARFLGAVTPPAQQPVPELPSGERPVFDVVPALEQNPARSQTLFVAEEDRYDRPPPMKQAILETIGSAGGKLVASGDVVDHLVEMYGWERASVRSAMVKMQQDGTLERPERGLYRLPGSTNAEDPAATGSSDGATTSGQGGEGTDVSPEHRHHGQAVGSDHRDHDRGASVVGG